MRFYNWGDILNDIIAIQGPKKDLHFEHNYKQLSI